MRLEFSQIVHESPVGDTVWVVAVYRDEAIARIQFGFTLGARSSDYSHPALVLDSVSIELGVDEAPYFTCGEVGQPDGGILAFANRGPGEPVARLAWRPSPESQRLVSVPPTAVHCVGES